MFDGRMCERWQMFGLAIAFGSLVGFALGLTGGGGGIFAVPLLVYGLAIPPREAVGISLAAVGGTAVFGAVPRLMRKDVELNTGLLFAIAGMLGAPVGSLIAGYINETLLLVMFAGLMLVVAQRMWAKSQPAATPDASPSMATSATATACVDQADGDSRVDSQGSGAACQRDSSGRLLLNSRCARLLALVGFATGVLSGLFGVGGGFVIVPALVLFSGMSIHRAVGTSLFIIVLISISGVASHYLNGNKVDIPLATLFLGGGAVGMWLGGLVANRLKGPTLQRIFSAAIVLVAAFVIFKTLMLNN